MYTERRASPYLVEERGTTKRARERSMREGLFSTLNSVLQKYFNTTVRANNERKEGKPSAANTFSDESRGKL